MKILPVVTCLVFSSSLFGRDFRPDAHFETLPATDASVQECYVFRTTAGVQYTVQFSNDLTHWTDQDEFYGLGNEYVVSMRQFTPPPPPPPGEPSPIQSPPARNASIRMERASGPAGGTVVSWASLDHGGPMAVRIAGEMAAEWFQIPLYAEQFGDFYFFVWHPSTIVSPPAENSILGAKDSAMLAVLEASLPTMNSQVMTSVAAVRNAPAPAPADPDSKRFWRVLVDPSTDTDTDGIADWSEFEMAANAAAGLPVHFVGNFQNKPAPGGNAFNSDSNGDGIPDGEQLDTDDDGIADAFDISSSDPTASYEIGPLPRYTLFEIPGNALQINNLGTVVYADKTWKGGVITPLPGGPAGSPLASARGINDLDVMIGTEGRDPQFPTIPRGLVGKICYWSSPSQPYQYLKVIEDGKSVFAFTWHGGSNQGPASIFSSSGHFIAPGDDSDESNDPMNIGDLFDYYPTLWQVPTGSLGTNRQAAPEGALYVSSPTLMWGSAYPYTSALLGTVHAPTALPNLTFVPFNVISQPLPKGGAAIFATPPVDFTNSTDGQTTKVYLDGKWQESPTYAQAIDISSDGTAIGQNQIGLTAPILLNGKWTDIKRYAPVQSDVFDPPPPWHDESVALLDTTPGGWILAQQGFYGPFENAVMLPIRAAGYYQRSDGGSITEAVGVDDFSIGSESPGIEVQDRIWIMAPQGGFNKIVKFKAPLNGDTPLNLSAPNIFFGGEESATISGPVNPVTLRAADTVSSGGERLMTLTMGSGINEVSSVSKPVGLKIMKGRTVKVTVYKVTKLYGTSAEEPVDQIMMPTEAEIANHLKDIFRPQVNTVLDVNLVEAPLRARWDDDNDANFDIRVGSPTGGEESNVLAEIPANPEPYDIRVFLVANSAPLGSGIDAYGLTDRAKRTCWVLGSRFGKNKNKPFLLDTIAHEIGHVFVGIGHPDQNAEPGPAPLPGTKHTCRLMCSGPNSDGSSRLLVKKEWDEAEKWMKSNIDDREPQ